MFRLFRAELKKIFLKPSIFVVTGLIILMLAVSTFIYNPATRSDTSLSYSFGTVQEYYDYFTTSSFSNAKQSIDNLIDVNATNYVNEYATKTDVIQQLKDDWADVQKLYNTGGNSDYKTTYRNWQEHQTASWKSALESKRQSLKTAISNFKQTFEDYCTKEEKMFLVTISHFEKTKKDFKNFTDIFDIAEASGLDDIDGNIIGAIENNDSFGIIENDLNGLYQFSPSESLINSLLPQVEVDGEMQENENSPINIAKARLNAIFAKIDDINTRKGSSTNKSDRNEIMAEINKYYLTANYAYNIVVNGIIVDGLTDYVTKDVTNFYGIGKKSYYEMKEDLTRTKYLFNNATYRYQYADVFSVTQPTNIKVNGFDYSYYALKLCAFFITVYIVVLAAGTIAGEQSAGTLKLLAIRPYSRNKLLSAKILATLTIGAILLFVSSIASLVIGGVTYGFNFTNVLAVFNSTTAFEVSPAIMYLIALIAMFVEVVFYAVLSIFISTVFKSNIGAVSISTLLFFFSLVLNTLAVSVPLLGLLPFVNVNFFKYFGSAFLPNSGEKLVSQILTPTVFTGSTFWSSLILYLLTTITLVVVTHVIFKKRDIK